MENKKMVAVGDMSVCELQSQFLVQKLQIARRDTLIDDIEKRVDEFTQKAWFVRLTEFMRLVQFILQLIAQFKQHKNGN